ncbi:hypothetical protein SHELI_v1c00570 [Spiroplasma helicoides]|uniref:Uncharacterized protein n=1 Tax=Spiroplasma helicoides TaxID=216938 RepID=A0A1B3SJA4_9MOLU|nr:hypothetical protein [Spiroplasma helicoides]AOG60012.1 hypothetical protein SHELI_v1c00570 [Spiroplasma helicoides]
MEYGFYERDYSKKEIDKSRIRKFLIIGTIETSFIGISLLVMGILGLFNKSSQSDSDSIWIMKTLIADTIIIIDVVFLAFLYIKTCFFAISLKNLYKHVSKTNTHKKIVVFLFIAFLPILGYFTTIIMYAIIAKELKTEGFVFKNIKHKRRKNKLLEEEPKKEEKVN